MKFKIIQDYNDNWEWVALAGNNRIVACSNNSYSSSDKARRALINFLNAADKATTWSEDFLTLYTVA